MILELVEVMENEFENDARKLGMETSIYMFKEGQVEQLHCDP
jgi:hypothetical protein